MSGRGSNQPRDWGAWMDHVDWVRAVRGASSAFTVEVISGLINPITERIDLVLGLIQLALGYLLGSVVAAWRTREADSPVLSAGFGALMGYTLSVPLIYITRRTIDWRYTIILAAVAVVIGVIAAWLMRRRGERSVLHRPRR